jgi:hypothetical protein
MQKQTYETPELVTFGSVEELTAGDGRGIKDFFVFGIDDAIGNCRDGSCDTDSGS